MELKPRNKSTSTFLENGLTFLFCCLRDERSDFVANRAGGTVVLAVVDSVIGVGHVDDLAEGGKVGFAIAQEAQAASAEVWEESLMGDLDFKVIG